MARLADARDPKGQSLRHLFPEEQEFIRNEYILCKSSYRYWAERYSYASTKGAGVRRMFPLFDSQELILNEFGRIEDSAAERGDDASGVMVNVLKARRLGCSTLAESLLMHRLSTQTYLHAVVASDVPGQSSYTIGMLKLIYDKLPWWLKPGLQSFSNTYPEEYVFDNGSHVWCHAGQSTRGVTGERGQLGRGKGIALAHLTELSTWDDTEQIDAALLPTMTPPHARVLAIFESSPRGRSNWWHKHWDTSMKGIGYFAPIFLPWYAEPKLYRRPAPPAWAPSPVTLAHARRCEEQGPTWLHRTVTMTRDQLFWYETVREYYSHKNRMNDFLQEYACLDGDHRVGTTRGVIPLREVRAGDVTASGVVIHAGQTGVREVMEVTTKQGRSLIGTPEHRVFLTSGEEREIQALQPGDKLQLAVPQVAAQPASCWWQPMPGYRAGFEMTDDWALLLGYFMGDGSYYKDRFTVSCDSRDVDVVEEIKALLQRVSGATPRYQQHTINGGAIMVQTQAWRPAMHALGCLRMRACDDRWMRRVCIPEAIWRGTQQHMRLFLSGLFEADGHRYKKGARIGFFGKELAFVRDVQHMLLTFGISSNIVHQKKRKDARSFYSGYGLYLGAAAARRFQALIGFRGERKNITWSARPNSAGKVISMADEVLSVRLLPAPRPVYDLTTETTHQFDASGILVHNSDPEECFVFSGRSLIPPDVIQRVTDQARPLLAAFEVAPLMDLQKGGV